MENYAAKYSQMFEYTVILLNIMKYTKTKYKTAVKL